MTPSGATLSPSEAGLLPPCWITHPPAGVLLRSGMVSLWENDVFAGNDDEKTSVNYILRVITIFQCLKITWKTSNNIFFF